MDKSIKPCPFCGSDFTDLIRIPFPHPEYYVYCGKCFAQGSEKSTEEMAIEIWNKVSKKLELHSWDESPERIGQ